MLEREAKREKILEARQKELRLKERSRSEQSREDEAGRDATEREESPEQLIARAEQDFFSMVEAEKRRRKEKEEEKKQVRTDGHQFVETHIVYQHIQEQCLCFLLLL